MRGVVRVGRAAAWVPSPCTTPARSCRSASSTRCRRPTASCTGRPAPCRACADGEPDRRRHRLLGGEPHTANVSQLRIVQPGEPDMRFASTGSYLRRWYGNYSPSASPSTTAPSPSAETRPPKSATVTRLVRSAPRRRRPRHLQPRPAIPRSHARPPLAPRTRNHPRSARGRTRFLHRRPRPSGSTLSSTTKRSIPPRLHDPRGGARGREVHPGFDDVGPVSVVGDWKTRRTTCARAADPERVRACRR